MKKRMVVLFVLAALILSGCTGDSGQTSERMPSASESLHSHDTEPPGQVMPPTELENVPPEDPGEGEDDSPLQDAYHNGEPYTPWGSEVILTLTTEDGNKTSFAGNFPDIDYELYYGEQIWRAAFQDSNNECVLFCVAEADPLVQDLETFFEDAAPLLVDAYDQSSVLKKEIAVQLRGITNVIENDRPMSRATGRYNWTIGEVEKTCSIVAYAFQAEDGTYLCCVVLCNGKEWPEAQKIAENFVNTYREVESVDG